MTAGSDHGDMFDQVARTYGTPAYVYQLEDVRRAAADLRSALPDQVGAYYSVKANPHPLVVGTLTGAGFDLEISSVGELDAARAAGADLGRCLYTGPGKTEAEMAAALAAGVRTFSLESAADHARLAGLGHPAGVRGLLRLNPTAARSVAGLRMTGGPSPFGIPIEQLDADSPLLREVGGLRPAGFHLYSATNVADGAALSAELAANVVTIAAVAEKTGLVPEIVDIGGGFGAPFTAPGARVTYSELRAALATVLDAELPGWRSGGPAVAVESGRYLVAGAGTLLTTVMDVKVSGDRRYVVCDAGVNALGGMSGLGRLLPPGAQPGGDQAGVEESVLVGPLCTPLDVLNRRAGLRAPRIGDVLAIPNVGAYGLTASLIAFLGRPLPVEVVLDGTSLAGVRRLALAEVR